MSSLQQSAMLYLNSLSVFKVTNESQAVEIASISVFGGYIDANNSDGFGSGVIDNNGGSYVSFNWLFPNWHMTGEYLCEAIGVGQSRKPSTLSVRANVVGGEVSFLALSDILRSYQIENLKKDEKLNSVLQTLSKKSEEWRIFKDNITKLISENSQKLAYIQSASTNLTNSFHEAKSRALETLFFQSSPYQGRRYFLTKQLILFTLTSAQASCQEYGGYLAEIDDEDELDFLRRFLSSYKYLIGVWISGSDEQVEGHWVSSRNNNALKYLKWGSSEPDQGRSQNCLNLWAGYNWFMGSYFCSLIRPELDTAYLCEIEDTL